MISSAESDEHPESIIELRQGGRVRQNQNRFYLCSSVFRPPPHLEAEKQRTMPELLGAMYANMHVHTSPSKRLVIYVFRRKPTTALPMPMHMYMNVVMMVMVPIGTVGSGGHGGRCVVRAPAMQRGRMGRMMLSQFSVPIAVAELARVAAGHGVRAAKPGKAEGGRATELKVSCGQVAARKSSTGLGSSDGRGW